MEDQYVARKGEKGNVLFLILIAVALFAALSYAVTQSTRSGGGSTEREKSILSGASMTQGPTALRTSIIRMILGGVDVSQLKFNPPSNAFFIGATSDEQKELVFHPNGGGGVYQQAPADLMTGSSQGTWFYNGNFYIPNIGTNDNDLIAFLPGITQGVCEQINDEFAINLTDCAVTQGDMPDFTATETIRENMIDGYSLPGTPQDLQGDNGGGTCQAFSGQPSGCFHDGTDFIFFSVLLER